MYTEEDLSTVIPGGLVGQTPTTSQKPVDTSKLFKDFRQGEKTTVEGVAVDVITCKFDGDKLYDMLRDQLKAVPGAESAQLTVALGMFRPLLKGLDDGVQITLYLVPGKDELAGMTIDITKFYNETLGSLMSMFGEDIFGGMGDGTSGGTMNSTADKIMFTFVLKNVNSATPVVIPEGVDKTNPLVPGGDDQDNDAVAHQ